MTPRARSFGWILALVLAIPAIDIAQINVVAIPPQAPADAAENSSGVYVRDSAIALEKLALARKMERLHEWAKSADVYQEILQKYPDRVIASQTDPQTQEVIQYTSVTETVLESLCRWPLDGLNVYRSLYETTAANLLASAGDGALDKLHQVFSLYFPTEAAKAAGIRLMDIYFEQGDYATVAQIGHRLLDWHPNLVAERPMTIYRTAIAEKLCGQMDDARTLQDQLRQKFPQATGTIRGQDVLLADSLDQELATASAVVRAASDSWLTVGGDASRSRSSFSQVKPGARLYSVPLAQVSWKNIPDLSQRQTLEQNDQDQRKKGAGLGVFPVVDHGQLFFQDNTRIYAIDLESGVPLPGWAATYPMENGVYKLPGSPPPVPLGRQLCLTINDKYVTGIMGLADPPSQIGLTAIQEPQLVCLDRRTGKELWITLLDKLPDSQTALRDLQMGGSPLIVGDNIYVIAHTAWPPRQFEDCYVLCFNVSNGAFRWACFVANSNSDEGTFLGQDDPSVMMTDAVSHLAYAGGRLFVITNLGAVASLDAYTGTIAWLDIYRTEAHLPPAGFNQAFIRAAIQQQQQNGSITTGVPWVYNPAVVQNGRLFVMPSDSRNLFIYDAATGREDVDHRIRLSDIQEVTDANDPSASDVPTTLLAVRDDLIYLAGARQVWQIPWKKLDVKKTPADETPGFWRSTDVVDINDTSNQNGQVRGHAFVTGDAVYLPTRTALRRILLRNGALDSLNSSFPKNGWESDDEGPGNVLVTQDHVIIAGDRQVAIYTDITLAQAKLDREIADAPSDPDPRLHYAEVMFAAGQGAVAEDKLDEAFQLLGGAGSLRAGAVRDRAFNDALNFAAKLSPRKDAADQVNRLFDLARSAAQSDAQRVAYLFARARFADSIVDAADALELYQQILVQPSYRTVAMPNPQSGESSQAGRVAETSIDQILSSQQGREAYEKYEQLAAAMLAKGVAAADPPSLLEVAVAYPNSRVARQAMIAAADVFESRGNFHMATQVLRRLMVRYRDQNPAEISESLARNYLRIPGHVDVAVARLSLAASISPDAKLLRPLTLPDRTILQDITLNAARETLGRYLIKSSMESLPDLHLPTSEQAKLYSRKMGSPVPPFLPESSTATITGVDALIVPLDGFSRNDRIVAWSGASGLSIYPIAKNVPIATCAAVDKQPLGAAWIDGHLLTWSASSIWRVDPDSAKPVWSMTTSALPAVAASPDSDSSQGNDASDPSSAPGQPHAPELIVQVEPIGDRIVLGTSIGRVLALDVADGKVAWQTRVGDGPADTLLANDDFTVLRVQESQTIGLIVLNSSTGELVGRKTFNGDGADIPVNLALSADGILAYTLPGQLCIQDLYEANSADQGMEPKPTSDMAANAGQIFAGANQPNQLLIYAGHVFAVADGGQEVRVFDVVTAKPWTANGQTVNGTFSTNSTSPNVTLRISGNYFYAFSLRTLIAHRLDPPTAHWTSSNYTSLPSYNQILFGKDFLVIVDRPSAPITVSNRLGKRVYLRMYNRAVNPDQTEAGNLVHNPQRGITVQGDVITFQPVDGGIVYFTGNTIHTLLGSRDTLTSGPPI